MNRAAAIVYLGSSLAACSTPARIDSSSPDALRATQKGPPLSGAPTVSAPRPSPSPPAPALAPIVDAAALSARLLSHRGHPMVVNVFASWCTPCRREMPSFEKLRARNAALVVLAIDVDDDEAAAAKFLPSVPQTFEIVRRPGGITPLLPSLRLPTDWNESVPPGWERSIPLTFVYDAKGDFATGSVGELSQEALKAIEEIAAGTAK